jgi:phosphoglycolate phosphatase-like HAD superfamily hydrolase
MAMRGMIFDIDGTLVDTNPAHVEAWRRAFQRFGYDVSPKRIELEIGKGGDLLVPSILGEELEERYGALSSAP